MAGAWCVGEGAERQGLRAVRRVDWHKVGSLPGALAFALSVKGSHGVLGAEGVQRSPLPSGRTIVKVGLFASNFKFLSITSCICGPIILFLINIFLLKYN